MKPKRANALRRRPGNQLRSNVARLKDALGELLLTAVHHLLPPGNTRAAVLLSLAVILRMIKRRLR